MEMELTEFDRAYGVLHGIDHEISQVRREEKAFRTTHSPYPKKQTDNRAELEQKWEEGLEKINAKYDVCFEKSRKVIYGYIQKEFSLPETIADKIYAKASKRVKYAGYFDILEAARDIGAEVRELLDLYEQAKIS